MAEVNIPNDHWLCKMDGYLTWRVIGPRINNPYEISYPDRVLLAMKKNRALVRSQIKVRCLSDGHEVLLIDNLAFPILSTEHPCLVGLTRNLLLGFLIHFGVEDEIERTIDRIQEEVREELEKREMNVSPTNGPQKTIGQIRAEHEAAKKKKAPVGSQVRIVRM